MTEERDHFPPDIAEQLGWYVYRLIDPRNGETFYIGKGSRLLLNNYRSDRSGLILYI